MITYDIRFCFKKQILFCMKVLQNQKIQCSKNIKEFFQVFLIFLILIFKIFEEFLEKQHVFKKKIQKRIKRKKIQKHDLEDLFSSSILPLSKNMPLMTK